MAGILPHIPVSATTLDASVTHLAAQHPEFPTVALQKGIAEWRAAKGGVFTIPISEIVEVADNQTR